MFRLSNFSNKQCLIHEQPDAVILSYQPAVNWSFIHDFLLTNEQLNSDKMDHLLAELKNRLEIVPDSVTSKHLVDRLVALGPQEEPLHLIELDNLIKQHYAWLRHLPRVNPFYAIKSNDEPSIVATSVLLGIGYDCASKSELERVLAHGVNSEKIIFAQPAKTIDALKFARESKVRTVFDSEFELKKIQQYYPEAE